MTTVRLNTIGELFDSERLVTEVGSVLPLEDARVDLEMQAGTPDKARQNHVKIAA